MNDIAATFQLLGFVRYLPNNESMKLGLCIDWNKVDNHMKKVRSRPRLEIDPECLRWTPLLAPTVNPFRSPDDNSGDQETENEEMKTESEDTATEAEIPEQKNETKAEPKQENQDESVVVTSSGRRRTRPLKYSETTYQTTPIVDGRKRKRDASQKISESVEDKPEETPRRQRSVARRAALHNDIEEVRRPSVKETIYASDSQESQDSADLAAITPVITIKGKTKRKLAWRGRQGKRRKAGKATVRNSSPAVKKSKLDESKAENDYKTDDSMDDPEKSNTVLSGEGDINSLKKPIAKQDEKAKNSEASSEDSSGEADDEMDVEEGEDKRSVSSKPATPRHVEENSTDNHTSDMELDSIHMDSPKSVAEKNQVINETATDKPEKHDNVDNKLEASATSGETSESTPKETEEMKSETRNGDLKVVDDKDTIIISESDDNNSQSCPLPSPKHNTVAPVDKNNENKPKEIDENESPSKVIPVVSTENAHIVLDPKVQEEVNTVKPSVDLIVPRINQIETIVVEGESDNANTPQVISPKKNDKSIINDSSKQKTPDKAYADVCDSKKCEVRKETVIQNVDEKSADKKSPTKIDALIQCLEPQRDMASNVKKPEIPKIDTFEETDIRNRTHTPIVSKESDLPYRNDNLNIRKDEIVITRNVVEPTLQTYQSPALAPVVNSMTIQQINPSQLSYMNHRVNVSKESQAVQTEKVQKTSEANRVINNIPDIPVINKPPTKLEVPHPISSPVISPVIPKVPNVTDINFLPRCQSANAAVNLGLERTDLDQNFVNSMQNSLGGSMHIVPNQSQNNQEKSDPNCKPREKSKLRDVRVNSAHSKLEKPEKKQGKNDTPRSTPEPKMFFPEQNTQASGRKPETSVPTNVINTTAITSKVETKSANEAPKKQDYYKKEKSNAAKCDSKNASLKHDKTCSSQLNLKADQNDLNKMLPKFKYDNELMPKADYAMNQIPNYHTTHAQYQWAPWDHTRIQGTWENRFLDMKNTDKNYLDKFQGFNLPHLEQMQKSPQKLHPKYDQKDFHNIAYGALSASGALYATTSLPHFKETKTPTSKSSDCSQKNECKPAKQSKTTTACQTQCEGKKSQAQQRNEAQLKQMMQQQANNKQQEVSTSCAEYRQQSPQVLTSPGCKTPFGQNGPCAQDKSDIDKKARQHAKKEDKDGGKEESCDGAAMSPALQSMGVYTPDSTSNSVHSVQYPACELDVSQLGLESPSSIGSDLASPCSMLHMPHPAPSPHAHHAHHAHAQYSHAHALHLPAMPGQQSQAQSQPKQQKITNRNRCETFSF